MALETCSAVSRYSCFVAYLKDFCYCLDQQVLWGPHAFEAHNCGAECKYALRNADEPWFRTQPHLGAIVGCTVFWTVHAAESSREMRQVHGIHSMVHGNMCDLSGNVDVLLALSPFGSHSHSHGRSVQDSAPRIRRIRTQGVWHAPRACYCCVDGHDTKCRK